jgi:uncharacterized membrane protein YhaH (DUF805 family)
VDWSHLLFSFRGRVNRGKYWLIGLLVIVAWLAFIIVGVAMLGSRVDDLFSLAGTALFLWFVGFILLVLTMWCGFAVGAKRLHDRDKSGWWLLLFYFAPSVLNGWQATTTDSGSAMIFGLIGTVISIWGLIELGFLRGTRGPNRFGPDPLGFSGEPLR